MDFFNFEWYVRVYNEFQPEREFYRIQDISYGKENFAVSCVNSLDKNYPEYVEYSQVRIPQSTVKINTGTYIIKHKYSYQGRPISKRTPDRALCVRYVFLLPR